jgi:hypothetical protein
MTLSTEQREQIFATASIEIIIDNAGTHLSPFDASTLRLTTGNDAIVMAPEGGQVVGTADTLNNGDSLTGGPGHDTLLLYGAGTYRLDLLGTFTGFEEIELVNVTGSATLWLPDGLDIAITGGGNGSKSYRLGTGQKTINGGAGLDQFVVTDPAALTAADSLHGGLGNDSLVLSLVGGTTFDLRGLDVESIEQLSFNTANGVLLIDQASLDGFTSISGSTTAMLVTGEATLDLSGKNVNNVSIGSSNPDGTVFTVSTSTPPSTSPAGRAATRLSPATSPSPRSSASRSSPPPRSRPSSTMPGPTLRRSMPRPDLVGTFTGFDEIQLVSSSGTATLWLLPSRGGRRVTASTPSAAIRMPCACSWRTGRPPQP